MSWVSLRPANPSSPVSACPHGAGIIAIRETMPGLSMGARTQTQVLMVINPVLLHTELSVQASEYQKSVVVN